MEGGGRRVCRVEGGDGESVGLREGNGRACRMEGGEWESV